MNMFTRPAAVIVTALSIALVCLGSALAQNAPNSAEKGIGLSDARAIVLEHATRRRRRKDVAAIEEETRVRGAAITRELRI